ncbi:prolyl oligopeptidase family serine peptidase [Mycolicibacterium sp. 624]|uniref:prolyl oligopeptidase family serine peptidase n=1 Tax=Mycolicibacterium sp. 624 TaxID=3156314 RepID=UPI003396A7E5
MPDLSTDSPDSRAWQAERTAETLTALHAIDGYAEFGAAVLLYSDAARRWTPIRAGDLWFQQKLLDAHAELPVVTVRDAVDGEPRVLVDLNDHAVAGGPPISAGWVRPSPDGKVLAYSIAAEGTEVNEVFLVDVVSGQRLPDRVPWNVHMSPSWLPDSTGFWCVSRETTADAVRMLVRRFILGEPASDWRAPLPDSLLFPRPEVSRDGRWVAIASGNTEMRVDFLISEDLRVLPFLDSVPGAFRGVITDGAFYALTDNDAPRGRIVRIPLETPTHPDTWTEILAETNNPITDFEIYGDTMVVASLRECSSALDLIDLKTRDRTAVPLPDRGGVGAVLERASYPTLPAFIRGTDEISFLYSDLATSPAIYRYLLDEHQLECLEAPSVTLEDLTVSYITAVSADGVQVPAHVIHRADLDLSRPHPTFLSGYGGFYVADLPAYINGHAAWVQAGGIHVLAHPRGGSEFGSDWWRDGRREKKQNTFNDFYAVAEKLIELGWTSSDHLAIYGASNGGLLTAVALTQRPDLWAAVVSDVPAIDLLNMDRNPLLYTICREEYGDATNPEERPWLQAIDPLANAKAADYPATLVVAGANDPRCPASHARQLVDKVSTLQTGDAPILLRVHAEQGHGPSGAIEAAQRLTEILTFCAVHTGLHIT